jgi:Ca2+-binding EF-hand superfamily protein
LAKIQDAAIEAAANGRPFLALCSLVDQKLIGTMSPADLIYVCKMMGTAVSQEELRSLQELLPPSAIAKDGSYDYREVFWLIQHHNSKKGKGTGKVVYDFPPRTMTMSPIMTGGSFYSSPGTMHLRDPDEDDEFDGRPIATPSGTLVSTPFRHTQTKRVPHSAAASEGAYKRQLMQISSDTKLAVEDKSRKWGAPFSLRRQFEVFDTELSGFVTLRTFQSILDEIGVILSASDIHALRRHYGRPEDDYIDYVDFCQTALGHDLRSTFNATLEESHNFSSTNKQSTLRDTFPPPSRATETLRALKETGQDPRDIFQAYDLEDTGLVSTASYSVKSV